MQIAKYGFTHISVIYLFHCEWLLDMLYMDFITVKSLIMEQEWYLKCTRLISAFKIVCSVEKKSWDTENPGLQARDFCGKLSAYAFSQQLF